MKIFFCIGISAAVLFAVPAFAQIGPDEQAAILAAHNNQRAMTGPAPGEAPLTWSNDLATYAQAWAQNLANQDQGLMHRDSSPNPADNTINNPIFPGQSLGENLFASTAPDDGTLGPAAVADWISEMQFYNHAADDGNGAAGLPPGCTAPQGNSCGHYTQVVWSTTTTVGCGKATSASGWTFIDCNYFPAGNIIPGLPF